MLPYLAPYMKRLWGPFRLFESHLTLICLGATLAALLSFLLLPRLWHLMPRDQGKPFVKNSEEAKGKPTGAGLIWTGIFIVCLFLVLPFDGQLWALTACLCVCMLCGFLDDASQGGWSEWKKGLWDAVIALIAAIIMCRGGNTVIWLPLIKGSLPGGGFLLPAWLYVPLAAALLWLSINVVNCSDGVDAMAGSLALLGLCALGAVLYGVVGHITLAKYFLVPHNPGGANWAIMIFCAAGALAGYVWHNANPSAVLMGDAGSRFLGLLIGLGVLACGNPFLYLAFAPILLVDGGIGLLKLSLLRTLKKLGYDVRPPLRNLVNVPGTANFADEEAVKKQLFIVRIIHAFRCPAHDHCRKNLGWSIPQVVIRFMLLQALLMPIILILILKLR